MWLIKKIILLGGFCQPPVNLMCLTCDHIKHNYQTKTSYFNSLPVVRVTLFYLCHSNFYNKS